MKSISVITIFVLLSGWVFAQEDTVQSINDDVVWHSLQSYSIEESDVWTVDDLGNLFISQKGSINKYDTTGVLKFSQSVKSYGKMRQLVPVNAMKLIHFSEDQQSICFLDNTLTPTEDCIDLIDEDIINAHLIGSSARSELIWVYDNVNSTLVLLPLEPGQQMRQEISNLRGIIAADDIHQIVEHQSKLRLLDSEGNLFTFDLYGALLKREEMHGLLQVDYHKSNGYYLFENELKVRKESRFSEESDFVELNLPIEGIYEFRFVKDFFYFRTAENVHKFKLQIKK